MLGGVCVAAVGLGVLTLAACGSDGTEALRKPLPPTTEPPSTLPISPSSTLDESSRPPINISSAESFASTESILTEKGISLEQATEVSAEDTFVFLPESLPALWSLKNPSGRYAVVGFVAPTGGWGLYVTGYSREENVMQVVRVKPGDDCFVTDALDAHVAFLSLPDDADVPAVTVEERVVACGA